MHAFHGVYVLFLFAANTDRGARGATQRRDKRLGATNDYVPFSTRCPGQGGTLRPRAGCCALSNTSMLIYVTP